jgi:hypothetical protein
MRGILSELLFYRNEDKKDIDANPGNFLRLVLLLTSRATDKSHDDHIVCTLTELKGHSTTKLFELLQARFSERTFVHQELGGRYTCAIVDGDARLVATITGHAEVKVEV